MSEPIVSLISHVESLQEVKREIVEEMFVVAPLVTSDEKDNDTAKMIKDQFENFETTFANIFKNQLEEIQRTNSMELNMMRYQMEKIEEKFKNLTEEMRRSNSDSKKIQNQLNIFAEMLDKTSENQSKELNDLACQLKRNQERTNEALKQLGKVTREPQSCSASKRTVNQEMNSFDIRVERNKKAYMEAQNNLQMNSASVKSIPSRKHRKRPAESTSSAPPPTKKHPDLSIVKTESGVEANQTLVSATILPLEHQQNLPLVPDSPERSVQVKEEEASQ